MIKRMADKFGHLGTLKVASDQSSSSTTSSVLSRQSLSTSLDSGFYRGSISTERTSVSEWSSNKRGGSVSMEIVENEPKPKPEEVVPQVIVRTPVRPKGSYRLADFIIQRTLGTGSFGRVHLGRFLPHLLNCGSWRLLQCEANIISASTQ